MSDAGQKTGMSSKTLLYLYGVWCGVVDLTTLSVQQLSEVKKQLDEGFTLERRFWSINRTRAPFTVVLSTTAGKKQICRLCKVNKRRREKGTWRLFLNEAPTEHLGKQILVPLTSSLYVPGNLKDAGKVLVDVGTGYYVEKVRKVIVLCWRSSQAMMQSNSTAKRSSFSIRTW